VFRPDGHHAVAVILERRTLDSVEQALLTDCAALLAIETYQRALIRLRLQAHAGSAAAHRLLESLESSTEVGVTERHVVDAWHYLWESDTAAVRGLNVIKEVPRER